jgi:hypothetical protein
VTFSLESLGHEGFGGFALKIAVLESLLWHARGVRCITFEDSSVSLLRTAVESGMHPSVLPDLSHHWWLVAPLYCKARAPLSISQTHTSTAVVSY